MRAEGIEVDTVAFAPVNLANGNYDAVIVVETLSPISFLLAA